MGSSKLHAGRSSGFKCILTLHENIYATRMVTWFAGKLGITCKNNLSWLIYAPWNSRYRSSTSTNVAPGVTCQVNSGETVSPTLSAGVVWRLSVSLPSDLPFCLFVSFCWASDSSYLRRLSWLTSTVRPIWGITSLTRYYSLSPTRGGNSELVFFFLIFKDNGKLPTRELSHSSCQFHIIKHEMVRMLILSAGKYISQ